MDSNPTLTSYPSLLQAVTDIFAAYLPPDDAAFVAGCLVDADARGVASHGIGRIPAYTKRLRLGLINPAPTFAVTPGDGATAHVDGDNGMGYLVARKAMNEAIARGRRHGVSLVLASHSNHFGIAATYLQQAIDADLGALVLTNAPPLMPVWGGRTPFLGTSPFAFAAPSRTTPIIGHGNIRGGIRQDPARRAPWRSDPAGLGTRCPWPGNDRSQCSHRRRGIADGRAQGLGARGSG